MKKKEERSRIEEIIDSILSGDYTDDELREIMDTCEEEIANEEEEKEAI